MTQLNLLQTNLETIYDQWSSSDTEFKKQKINLILPVVQLASYLTKLNLADGTKILENFSDSYTNLYQQDITKLGVSDITPKLLERVTEVQHQGPKLTASETTELLKYENKYIHAHSRVMFNYGDFLQQIEPQLSSENRSAIEQRKSLIRSSSNGEAVLLNLTQLNAEFDLEKHSRLIAKDDLENHALLNQITNLGLNISQISESLLDETRFEKMRQTFASQATKFQVKRTTPDSDLSNFASDLQEHGLEMQIGLESEFLLNSLSKPKNPETPTEQNIALKKVLADLNARRRMQKKYGFDSSIPEISDVTLFFEEDHERHSGISNADFTQIFDDLKKNNFPESWPQIETAISNFSEAETFFYKLLFLTDSAKEHQIEMDGIYHPAKSKAANLNVVTPLILSGRFHEHLLDMIQAYEISVGPYNIAEVIDHKNAAFSEMKLLANQTGLSLDNANVQINSSLWISTAPNQKENILLPKIIKNEETGEVKIWSNQLAVEFLHAMEEAVGELSSVPGVLRNQSEITTTLDRNKVIGAELSDTPFRHVDENISAFINHKSIAAKNSTLRLSLVNNEVAVVEVRLVGNNPHFAKFDNSQDVYQSGIEFISEEFLAKFAQKSKEFLTGKNKNDLLELYQQKVEINHQGKIAGLDSVAVESVQRDNIYNQDSQEFYNPQQAAQNAAVVKYEAPKTITEIISSSQIANATLVRGY